MKRILYHYTKVGRFKEIIKAKRLLLSNYKDLDDNREIIHGFEYITQKLNKTFLNKGAINFDQLMKELMPSECYIFCTSPKKDNAYLWKKYANNDTGVAVGFDFDELYTHYFKENLNLLPRPVLYGHEGFEKQVDDCIENLNPDTFKFTSVPRDIGDMYRINPAFQESSKLAPLYIDSYSLKHNKFSEEEEVRLINLYHQPIPNHSEQVTASLPKYLGKAIVDLSRSQSLFIEEIIIGKKCPYGKNKKLERFITQHFTEKVPKIIYP